MKRHPRIFRVCLEVTVTQKHQIMAQVIVMLHDNAELCGTSPAPSEEWENLIAPILEELEEGACPMAKITQFILTVVAHYVNKATDTKTHGSATEVISQTRKRFTDAANTQDEGTTASQIEALFDMVQATLIDPVPILNAAPLEIVYSSLEVLEKGVPDCYENVPAIRYNIEEEKPHAAVDNSYQFF